VIDWLCRESLGAAAGGTAQPPDRQ
jgi:hypothetical protein